MRFLFFSFFLTAIADDCVEEVAGLQIKYDPALLESENQTSDSSENQTFDSSENQTFDSSESENRTPSALVESLDEAIPHCGPPAQPDDVNGGKKCGELGCLNGNKKYHSLEEAWAACGETPGCGYIMKYSNDKFYLRRFHDPDYTTDKGTTGYTYNCCPVPDNLSTMGGKGCESAGSCLNGNKAYASLGAAWRACRYNEGCTHVMEWTNGAFYLRRSTDPDLSEGKIMQFTCCPIPSPNMVGKKCPLQGGCIAGNVGYDSIGEAWLACEELGDACGNILKYTDNKYYLRRPNDPDFTEKDLNISLIAGYNYSCA